jgi:hypothetical protein
MLLVALYIFTTLALQLKVVRLTPVLSTVLKLVMARSTKIDFLLECLKNWSRRYDHNFLRFLPISGENFGVFLKKTPML